MIKKININFILIRFARVTHCFSNSTIDIILETNELRCGEFNDNPDVYKGIWEKPAKNTKSAKGLMCLFKMVNKSINAHSC